MLPSSYPRGHVHRQELRGMSSSLVRLLMGLYLATACFMISGCLGTAAPRQTSLTSNRCNPADLPEFLPTNLTSVAYLAFGNSHEFHIHGEFFANFTTSEHTTFFTLTEESYFRLSVAPQKDLDVDLYLYSADSRAAIASAISFYGEELITQTLPPGNYHVRFNFLVFSAVTEPDSEACKTILLEWTIVPKAQAKLRATKFICPSDEELPKLPLSLTLNEPYYFNSTKVYNAQTNAPSSGPTDIRLFKDYNFTVPQSNDGAMALWRVDAVLGYDFLTGGNLGMMLDFNATTRESDLDCITRTYGILYPSDDQCTVAVDTRINEAVISWVVGPGQYTLWLYELFNQTDKSVLGCVPFTFSLSLTPMKKSENLMNCPVPHLPHNLNVPGLLGDRGVLEYAENVLLGLAYSEHVIQFTLDQLSNFRAYTEKHRVDIDLKLSNRSGILAQSLTFNQEESIVATLSPGSYNLTVKYFAIVNQQFCETFFFMVAIAPQSRVPSSQCSNSGLTQAPDLKKYLSAPQIGTVSIPQATYQYNWPDNNRASKLIYQSWFVPETPALLKIVLGIDFLLDDMRLVVSWKDGDAQKEVIGTHRHGIILLAVDVPPQNVTISIWTGYTVQRNLQLPSFPSCIKYTFQLDLEPIIASSKICPQHVSLSSAINTTQALGLLEVHLSDRFLIPSRESFAGLVTESISISVEKISQFRLFCEAPDVDNNVDVDFHLAENDRIVALAISTKEEEEITYTMRPGKVYTLTIYYFLPLDGTSFKCMSYSLELSMSPYGSGAQSCGGLPDKLPPTDLITPNGKYFSSVATYSFAQTNSPLHYNISFTLDQPYFFRSVISYDFLWNNLNIRLWMKPSNNRLAYGKTAYNRNEIDVVQLIEGDYLLEIYEPSLVNLEARGGCVKFDLLVALLPVAPSADNPSFARCLDVTLPSNVTGLTGISTLSGKSMHWQRDVLATAQNNKEDYMSFSLDVDSIFRFYVPYHKSLDVDLYLYKGTPDNPGIMEGSPKISFGEEAMEYKLAPGPYFLKTKIYPQHGTSLPSPTDCSFYPAEAAIVPVQTLTTNPIVAEACQNKPIPKTLQSNVLSTGTYHYMRTSTLLQEKIAFNITSHGHLSLDLRYDFASSGVSAQLTRFETATSSKDTFHSKIGTNHAFLRAVLIPGSYELVIRDPVTDFRISELKCLTFEMTYKLDSNVTSGNDPSDDGCDTSQLVPANLFDTVGGSVPFGGPQAADGSVRIFAKHILMPTERFTSDDILFINPKDSYMRLFAHSDSSANDVDFYIYSNANKSAGSLIGISNSVQEIESALFFLPATHQAYLLEVRYFKIDTSRPCNYFHLELAMEPRAKVLQELLCPIHITSPPTNIMFAAGADVSIYRDDYVFTAALINATSGTFRYSIRLNVVDKTTFGAEIGFNFLANDFRLVLRNSNNEVLLNSRVQGTGNQNSYINFYHALWAELEPGTYSLGIEENLMKKSLKLNSTMCHRFSLSISGISETTPHVLSVIPPEGHDLDPTKDLIIQITFTDPVAQPLDVEAYLFNHFPPDQAPGIALFHLSESRPPGGHRSDGAWIRPSHVQFTDSSRRTLNVVFSKTEFTPDANFELVFNLTEFTTESGAHFAHAVQRSHLYSMISVTCSDHGQSEQQPDGSFVCKCDTGYAGSNCDKCNVGYHSVGNKCVANVACKPNTCYGHGSCDDELGFPICSCYPNYATVGTNSCSVCAAGYENYPACTAIPESLSGHRCQGAQLLPNRIDTIAFLGYNNETRLQGYYYVDVDHTEHNIQFVLKEDSLFRIYMEPHWVDIDVWLFLVTESQMKTIANGGLAIGKEESLFLTLNKTVGSDYYLLQFRYFVFSSNRPACETVNIDLAIAPLVRSQQRIDAKKDLCQATLTSSTSLPLANRDIIHVDYDSGNFFYTPTSKFAVASSNLPPETAPFRDRGYYFWNKTIALTAVPANHVAILRAEVSYSFLESDFSLLLESGSERPNHCSSGSHKSCIYGFNTYNKNILETVIRPNTYTLWLYQPERIFGTCALFEFSMSIRFEPEDSKTFACEGAELPISLNDENAINPVTGYLHTAETYLIDFVQYSFFEVKTLTHFKMTGKPVDDSVDFSLSLFAEGNNTDLDYVIETNTIHRLLQPGKYSIFVIALSSTDFEACPEVWIELELVPQLLYAAMLAYELSHDPCPFPPSVTPMLPEPLVDELYQYNQSLVALWAFGIGDIESYPIEITEKTRVIASVESAFLWHDLRLELRNSRTGTVMHSYNDFNRAVLDTVLEAGRYFLVITRPIFANAPERPFECSPFDFKLLVLPIYDVSASFRRSLPPSSLPIQHDSEREHLKQQIENGDFSMSKMKFTNNDGKHKRDSDPFDLGPIVYLSCADQPLEELPHTLNSKRFLYSDPLINYQSDNFFIPSTTSILESHEIMITTLDEAVLRVYVGAYFDVDIDLKLYMAIGLNDTFTQVASAANGIYNEEVIVAKIVPTVGQQTARYKLRILFWTWNMANFGKCQTFNMEMALTPISMIGNQSSMCPNHGDKWPPGFPPDMPTKEYHYNSLDPLGKGDYIPELLYITQGKEPKNRTYEFQLGPEPADLHVHLGYDFGLGDMAMTLTHKGTGDVFHGINRYNGNYITQANLLPGTYTLKIYEPAANHIDVLKCSYFTFEAHVVQGGKGIVLDPEKPTLPPTLDLNGVSYLFYEGHTHFQGDMTIFESDESVNTKDILFRVDKPSMLRASLHDTEQRYRDQQVKLTLLKPGSPLVVRNNTIYTSLDINQDYTLRINKPDTVQDIDFVQSFELAIERTATLTDYIQHTANHHARCNPFMQHAGVVNVPLSHAYTYHDIHTIDSTHIRPGYAIPAIAKFSFTVHTTSVVFARVGFQYTLNELLLTIHSNDPIFGDSVLLPFHYKNFNELDLLVSPGTYTIQVDIVNPSIVWEQLRQPHLNHVCVPYSLAVAVDDAQHGGGHADCTSFQPVPLDLDSEGGDSVQFGGPIKEGYVHISGDIFTASGLSRFTKATDTMSFTLRTKSVISLFTIVPEGHNFAIQYRLYNKRLGAFVEPSFSKHTNYQRSELFIVDVNEPTVFEMVLEYEKDSYLSLKSCPSFGLDLEIDQYRRVLSKLTCPSFAGVAPSPKTSLHLLASNSTAMDFVSTNLSTSFINSHLSGDTFVYNITLNVEGSSSMTADLAYSSLSNAFSFKVFRTGTNQEIGGSSLAMVPQRSGQTNVIQSLSGYLRAGEYTIAIEQPPLPFWGPGQFCYPFVWDILVRTTDITNIVEKVEPASAVQLDPNQELVIFIAFSARPYRAGKPVDLNNPEPIRQAFVLRDTRSEEKHPSRVAARSSDATSWQLQFDPQTLLEGRTYTLILAANYLQNSNGYPVIMRGQQFTYATASSGCSGHGTYIPGTGQCDCAQGYAGDECELCAPGYNRTAQGCVPASQGACKIDTCGCLRNNGQCIPLGTCQDLGDGNVQCVCLNVYHTTGDRCQKCLPGFYGWPACQSRTSCNPTCSKNAVSCDVEKNKCICPPNWAGSTCSECAPGYSGKDCSPSSSDPSGWDAFFKTFGIIVGSLIVVSAISWVAWWRYKIWRSRRPRPYLPLGLEELEGATELRGGTDDESGFADDLLVMPDKEENEPDSNSSSSTTPRARAADIDGDNDFDPRADKSSHATTTAPPPSSSSPSLLDL